MQFSHRTGDTSLNALSLRSQELKAQGVQLFNLNDSNPTHFGLSVHGADYIYSAHPRGGVETRRILSSYLSGRYGIEMDAEHLYLLNSTSQAYAWLSMLLCDYGDRILYPQPGYPLIESICALTGVQSVPYRVRYDGSWIIDYVSIAQQLEKHNYPGAEHPIKALVLINPNNPTASYVKAEERERILDLCAHYEVAIIADEVFYDFALDAFDSRARLAGEKRVLTFALDGFSKMLAAADVKVGWVYISGPVDEVREACNRLDMIADDFLPMSSLIEKEIPELLHHADAQTARIRRRTCENLAWLKTYTSDTRQTKGYVSVLRAEGGFNVLLRLPSSLEDDAVGLELLDKIHAQSAPGYFFDFESSGYMAVSLLPEPEIFRTMVIQVIRILENEIEKL